MSHNEGSPRDQRSASWIWTERENPRPRNRFTWFRRTVDLTGEPVDGTLEVAANSNTALWVNGQRVLTKVPRFDEKDIRSQAVNIAQHLHDGINVFVALHHSWGDIITFQRTGLTQAGLWISGEVVTTDRSWRWKYADEFDPSPQQLAGLLGPEHTRVRFPISWDATGPTDYWAAHDPGFDDYSWNNAIEIAPPAGNPRRPARAETPPQRASVQRPFNVLAAGSASYPAGIDSEFAEFTEATHVVTPELGHAANSGLISGGGELALEGTRGEIRFLTVDFGRPIHGYPVLELASTATALVRIGYAELAYSHYDGSPHVNHTGWIRSDGVVAAGYIDRIHLRGELRRFVLPDERTCRWLRLEVQFLEDGTVRVGDLAIEKSQYPIVARGSFESGDERIQQIVKLGLIHAEVTMSDAYVDTPGREDGQWIEDARPRTLLAARWFGDTALRRALIRTVADGQHPDGNLHSFYPSNFTLVAPTWDWSLQWVGMLHDEYMWSNDRAFVAGHLSTLIRFWAGLLDTVGDDGLWRSTAVLGDLRTSVPPEQGETSVLVTPWVIERLEDSSRLATAVGDDDAAKRWARQANAMRASYRNQLLRTVPGTDIVYAPDVVNPVTGQAKGMSQAAQITALTAGLLDHVDAVRLINYAFPAPVAAPPAGMQRWNNPTWSHRLLKVLCRYGFDRRAVQHLLERYAPYLPGHPRNPTPLQFQGPYGGPLPEYWISAEDLGIAPGEPNPHTNIDPTGSHGWGAVPLLTLHDTLLGVVITQPGGAEISIQPRTGGLPYVAGTAITPRGPVFVSFDSQSLELSVVVPDGCQATIYLPFECHAVTMKWGTQEISTATATVGSGQHEFAPKSRRAEE